MLCSALSDGSPCLTERVPCCALCGSDVHEKLFDNWDRLYHLPGMFTVVRCRTCRLVRLSPRPSLDSLSDYYPQEDYYSYQVPEGCLRPSDSEGRFRALRDGVRNSVLHAMGYPAPEPSLWQRLLQPIFWWLGRNRTFYGEVYAHRFPRYVAGGRILDVGCGCGIFLYYLKRHGWQTFGVEMNHTAAARAKEAFGIEVFPGELRDAPFEPDSFDVVQMNHVIEHCPEPLDELRRMARLLKPGGSLFIGTPNVVCFNARRGGAYWRPWETPRHLYLFSPATLTAALEKAGLRVTQLKTAVQDWYEWEDTYHREERERRKLPNRPDQSSGWFRRRLLAATNRVNHFVRPLDGDEIRCWARKDT